MQTDTAVRVTSHSPVFWLEAEAMSYVPAYLALVDAQLPYHSIFVGRTPKSDPVVIFGQISFAPPQHLEYACMLQLRSRTSNVGLRHVVEDHFVALYRNTFQMEPCYCHLPPS